MQIPKDFRLSNKNLANFSELPQDSSSDIARSDIKQTTRTYATAKINHAQSILRRTFKCPSCRLAQDIKHINISKSNLHFQCRPRTVRVHLLQYIMVCSTTILLFVHKQIQYASVDLHLCHDLPSVEHAPRISR